MRKAIIIITLSILSLSTLYGQSLAPEVTATSGDFYTGTNATLSWTIGEAVIETFTGANAVLTQGFQQPEFVITSIQKAPSFIYQISVYPNPTSDLIHINILSEDHESFIVELIDLQGKILEYIEMNEQINAIHLKDHASSMYILKVYNKNKQFLQSYRISKL